MTTVCWDGNVLAVDTRITLRDMVDGTVKDRRDAAIKMFGGDGFDFQGHPIEVFAFAGDVDLMNAILASMHQIYLDEDFTSSRDLGDMSFYKQSEKIGKMNGELNIIFVMADFTACIGLEVKEGNILLGVHKWLRTQKLMVGTGRAALMNRFTPSFVAKLNSIAVVAMAGWYDPNTGGHVVFWNATTKVFKESDPKAKPFKMAMARAMMVVLGGLMRGVELLSGKVEERRKTRANASTL